MMSRGKSPAVKLLGPKTVSGTLLTKYGKGNVLAAVLGPETYTKIKKR
jgi:hypothetical protein